jgi:phosphatidylglycerophosphate synthase
MKALRGSRVDVGSAFEDGRSITLKAGQGRPTEKRDADASFAVNGTGALRASPDGESDRPTVPATVAECYFAARQARGGGFLFSRTVSDKLGTFVAAIGIRLGAHPTHLTLVNLVLGVGGSVAVLVGRSEGRIAPLLVVGVVLWQVAYIFDCADGQVARATGKTSAYGASVDVFVDVAVQISVVAAVSSVQLSRHEIPALLAVLFASAWCLNFVTFLLAKGDDQVSHSLVARRSALVSVAKLLRDYGFVILLLGVWLLASPSTLFVPVMAVTATNLALLAGYIARAAYRSVRAPRQMQGQTTDHALRGN